MTDTTTSTPPPTTSTPPPTSATSVTASYVTQVQAGAKWAVAALATVGASAVTKLGLDQLGKGDLDPARLAMTFAGLFGFTVGVVLIIAAVLWNLRADRVTLSYLLGKSNFARQEKAILEKSHYFFGGPTTLKALRDRLNELVSQDTLSTGEEAELDRLDQARIETLLTARADRVRWVNTRATIVLLIGAVMATSGAAAFALATNRDVVVRSDRLAQEQNEIVTGTLLPHTPSSIVLDVPKSLQSSIKPKVGASCPLGHAPALLLEIRKPPARIHNGTFTFHVVTERTTRCSVAGLWVPRSWVLPNPVVTVSPAPTKAPTS